MHIIYRDGKLEIIGDGRSLTKIIYFQQSDRMDWMSMKLLEMI